MFKNMSLGQKLLTSFVSAAAIFALFAAFTAFLMQSTFSVDTQTAQNASANQDRLWALERRFSEIRRMTAAAASSRNTQDAGRAIAAVSAEVGNMLNDLNFIRGFPAPMLLTQQFSVMEQSLNQYRNTMQGISAEPIQAFISEIDYFLTNAEPNLAANINSAINTGLTLAGSELNASMHIDGFGANTGTIILVAVFFVSIILLIVIFYTLNQKIINPAAKLAALSKNLAEGNFRDVEKYKSGDELGLLSDSLNIIVDNLGKLKTLQSNLVHHIQRGEYGGTLPEEQFPGDFRELAAATNGIIAGFENELDTITSSIERFANGDFAAVSRMRRSNKYNSSVNDMSVSLKATCFDIQNMLALSSAGDFKNRMEVSKYNGEWQKIAIGINSLIDSVAIPITQMKCVLDDAASGKFDAKVTAEAKGDLLKLKVSINNAFANLTKYLKTITESLKDIGGRSRISLDLPGDLAPIKIALSELNENAGLKNSASQAAAFETPSASKTRSTSTNRNRDSDVKRFSGAPKVENLGLRDRGQPDYTRSDFGKY